MSGDEQHPAPDPGGASTRDAAYTERLRSLQTVWWKRVLPVQAPYRWNVRRLRSANTLDVGCGLGRNLAHLRGRGVGVDHNPQFVAEARRRGLRAWTTQDFPGSPDAVEGGYDALLLAHVVEHVDAATAEEIMRTYLPYLARGGAVHVITPQEVGQDSDPTHVRFCDFEVVERLLTGHGLVVQRRYSFPFPRPVGKVFVYNEFNVVARKP